MAKRFSFLVHGDVQGVGFRYFTRKQATSMNLTGWVRNTHNNKVEGEAQGEDEQLQNFLKAIDRGPPGSHVVKLEKTEKEVVDDEEGFYVKR